MERSSVPTIEQIVLASSSPRRKTLIESLGLALPLIVLPSDADESIPEDWSPVAAVEQLALRKAEETLHLLEKRQGSGSGPSALIIGADTIVVLGTEMLGKPSTRDEAVSMLQRLQGHTHEVYTGVAVIRTTDGRKTVSHRITQVQMKPLDSMRIERYVASGEPMDKAGSYAIQGLGATLVERINGCYFNVVGLPLSLLADMLSEHGVDVM